LISATADSDIYISALAFGGRALEFLDAARNGQFKLVLSEALLVEVLRVLEPSSDGLRMRSTRRGS
jgi:hypothetical protein